MVAELNAFGQRLLLHTESSEGSVIPLWEDVEPQQVTALKEIMNQQQVPNGLPLQYHRIPITSETPPDFSDVSELMDVVLRTGSDRGVIVVNCQLGRGRSTLTSVCQCLGLFNLILIYSDVGFDRPHPTMAQGCSAL